MMKRTVLIVDDQLINRRILNKMLAGEYLVLEADNGQTALDSLRANAEKISAVLLDIVMPVMDGYEVLNVMSADPVLSKIPVIVCSQKEGEEAEIKALSLGAQEYVSKPYKVEIILRRMKNMIRLRETAALINKVEKDELTGLYNKQFFIENVTEQLLQNPTQSYDIIFVGVERFKLINETYGVERGDDLLRHIAEVLQSFKHPVLSARFTADNFYLLMPHQDVHDNALFEEWVKKINEFPIDMDVKIHCGIYEINETQTPVSVMCDRAQLAGQKNKGMYDALFCLYDDSLRAKLVEEQFITSHMRSALEERQFHVYYQPKYDLNNELVAGAEALVRWIHPVKGFMSPDAFIPLFERNGFIMELDQYVWETACRDIRSWMNKGYPLVSVSVNVSRADIYNPKLSDVLLGLLAKYQVPIRYLHLEITESAYTDNPEQIIMVVNRLRELGFIIEMDDFGSGYSSLNMLAEMPVDVLKLDMRFIQSETAKASGKGILSFVISLAKWLNLAVVAEGVETAEQIATLRSMDCNYVQGFYYARPMKLEAFDELLSTCKTSELICHSQTLQQYEISNVKDEDIESSGTMLIVDDIELNRVVLASAFENSFHIVERENGSTAWQYLQEHYNTVDIVLLDLLMPVMDGFTLLEKIRADKRMNDLPVIITSQGDKDSEERALRMRADDFISKPYNPDIIRHRVRNAVAVHQLALLREKERDEQTDLSVEARAYQTLHSLKPYFDIVRLVEPEHTLVCGSELHDPCEVHACYAVWGKATRCNNCISLKALHEQSRVCKLEYTDNALYFVISQFVPFGSTGAVIEMVTRLDDEYVDNVLDKKLLFAKLDAVHQKLDMDELTGLYNRRYIDRMLARALAQCADNHVQLGLCMIDVDHFKALNDQYGHLAGDTVLQMVARILKENAVIGKGDFAARFGGDEFLVVCRGIDSTQMRGRIEKAARIITHIAPDGMKMKVSVSGGLVMNTELPDATAAQLIDRADKRLYQAKANHRGTVAVGDDEGCPPSNS